MAHLKEIQLCVPKLQGERWVQDLGGGLVLVVVAGSENVDVC